MLSKAVSQKTILVIDDDPDILTFLQDLLELEGYHVFATNRGEYLETIRQEDLPDLILLDVFLSGKDGRKIIKYLKAQEMTKLIPVIMFSAYPGVEAVVRATGADDFLSKPFDTDILLTKVQAFLS